MAEEVKVEKKEKKQPGVKVLVVSELPTEVVTSGTDGEGNTVELLTIEQALTMIYQDLKDLKKGLL